MALDRYETEHDFSEAGPHDRRTPAHTLSPINDALKTVGYLFESFFTTNQLNISRADISPPQAHRPNDTRKRNKSRGSAKHLPSDVGKEARELLTG